MRKSLSPVTIAVILVVVVAIIGFFGYRQLNPPTPPHGIIDGRPMTDADVHNMAKQMRAAAEAHHPGQ